MPLTKQVLIQQSAHRGEGHSCDWTAGLRGPYDLQKRSEVSQRLNLGPLCRKGSTSFTLCKTDGIQQMHPGTESEQNTCFDLATLKS